MEVGLVRDGVLARRDDTFAILRAGTTRGWGYYDETYELGSDGAWRISSMKTVMLRGEQG